MRWIDHIGREVDVPDHPERIISLCPSQTSTLFALGLQGRVVGRTHFCIHPATVVDEIVAVGGTKNLKYDRVEALNPDLVICEKEENTPEMVAWLSQRFPVFVTDVKDLESASRMVLDLGKITGTADHAALLQLEIEQAMQRIQPFPGSPSVLYFIWRKPWMLAGNDTYIQSILHRLGFSNLALSWPGRYPELPQDISGLSPDFIFLSSEPFPFTQKHVGELQKMFPASSIHLVDGEMFSWYGEKQRDLAAYWGELSSQLLQGPFSKS